MPKILAELDLEEALIITQRRLRLGTLVGALDQTPAPAPRDSVRDAAPS